MKVPILKKSLFKRIGDNMTIKLLIQALLKYIIGFLVVGILIFLPAGTISFWKGWLLIGVLFIPMFIIGVILMIGSPKLLEKRLNTKEKEEEQKEVVILSSIMFILGFTIAGLNARLNWQSLPTIVSYIAAFIFLIAYLFYMEVLRENEYLSRVIEVQKDQKIVDTGLYRIVRHPMYAATIFMFLMIPLVLGSLISFFIFLIYPFIIIKRIQNEEKILEKELKGYKEYQKKVKYKLIPYIW